jgi:hypothetical protein
MYVTTNSAVVWKRVADENQHSIRLLVRICIGLFVLSIVSGVFAYASHVRYDNLCTSIERQSRAADAKAAQTFGETISSAYCS